MFARAALGGGGRCNRGLRSLHRQSDRIASSGCCANSPSCSYESRSSKNSEKIGGKPVGGFGLRRENSLNLLSRGPVGLDLTLLAWSDRSGTTQLRPLSTGAGDPVPEIPEYGKPTYEQLNHIRLRVADTAPLVFLRQMDYTFYSQYVVYEDRIFNYVRHGLRAYWAHMAAIRVFSFFLFPYIELEALSVLPMIEDGTVRLRWRVKYFSWFRALNVFAYPPTTRNTYRDNARWFDGYSIFYVSGDGFVFRVITDRVVPDDERFLANKSKTVVEKLAAKLAPTNSSGNADITSTKMTATTRQAKADATTKL